MPTIENSYALDIFSEGNIRKSVLPHYNLEDSEIFRVKFKNTDKQRAVYKVTTSEDSYCLKKVYFNERELLFVYSAIEWLHRSDIKVPRILPNINNGRFVNYNNMLFILTPWIEGDKCDYNNKNHLDIVCKNLALTHNRCNTFFPIKNSANRVGYKDFYYEINKHFNRLLVCSNLAFKHNDTFSKIYIENFNDGIDLATSSCKVLSSLTLDNLSISLCHNDYVNKNLIIKNDDEVWVIDFDKCRMDFSIHDFAYFLRRLLRREETKWDINITIDCLKSYESIREINLDDYKYLFGYLSFPQRYWKISRDYYRNIYKCNKKAFVKILEKSVRNFNNQRQFVNEFKSYIDDKFNCNLDI